MVASWMPLYADRQTVRERRSQNENREASKEPATREQRREKNEKGGRNCSAWNPDKLPPFPETAKKKKKKKRNHNQRSIRAEMISSPTEVIGDHVPIDDS